MATMTLTNPRGFPGPDNTFRSHLRTHAQKQVYQMRLKSDTQKMNAGQEVRIGTGTRLMHKGTAHPIGSPGAASPEHLVTPITLKDLLRKIVLKDILREMARGAALAAQAHPSIAPLEVVRVVGPCLGPQPGPSQGPASPRSCQEHEG